MSGGDVWTVGDACEGTQIFGATGSGKTSGSGKAIAGAFLERGFGGLVLCAKPDERRLWEALAAASGRSHHLMVFGADAKWRFNFLNYELNRAGAGAGFTENIVNLFSQVAELAEGGHRGGSNDEYWGRTLKQLLRNAVELLAIAKGEVTLADIYEVIQSAPQDMDEARSDSWQASSACGLCLARVNKLSMAGRLTPAKERDFLLTGKYWMREFPTLAEKTRSIIVSTFTSLADPLLRSPMFELFCTNTNIVPEMTHEGAIIVVDLPVLEFSQVGQNAQVLWKLLWQKATERRDVTKSPRPVFLWADESQYFVTKADARFQSTARSSRACTVYLTQNLPTYYAAVGGDRHPVDSLLGNLQTKIFHANSDVTTNQWAADVVAKDETQKISTTSNTNEGKDGQHHSGGINISDHLEHQINPIAFTRLGKGGAANDFTVDGILFQGGRTWKATGKTFMNVRFKQK